MKQSSEKDTELKKQKGDRQAKTPIVFLSFQIHSDKTGGHVLAAVAYRAVLMMGQLGARSSLSSTPGLHAERLTVSLFLKSAPTRKVIELVSHQSSDPAGQQYGK